LLESRETCQSCLFAGKEQTNLAVLALHPERTNPVKELRKSLHWDMRPSRAGCQWEKLLQRLILTEKVLVAHLAMVLGLLGRIQDLDVLTDQQTKG
jgi:hypothetical protein